VANLPRGRVMQIGGFTSYASSAPVLNPVHLAKAASNASTSSATSSSSTAAVSAAPVSATASASQSSAAPARSSHAKSAQGGGGGGGAAAAEETMAAAYSTTVAGKQYSGSVEKSGNEYTASVSNLAGADASGSSIQSAENNLNIKIDILV